MTRPSRQVFLITTALFGVGFLSLAPDASAFDPNAGKDAPPPVAAAYLPDPSVLYQTTGSYRPPPTAPPPMATIAPAAGVGAPGYISPLPSMQMPLYPARSTAAPPALPPAPEFPPVSPDVASKARAMMSQPAGTALPSIEVPPPLPPLAPLAPPTVAQTSPAIPPAVPLAPPAAQANTVPLSGNQVVDAAGPLTITPASSKLSDQTREILSSIPSNVGTPKPSKGVDVKMDRVTPEIAAILGDGIKEDEFESVGLSIKVRRPGLDADFELDRAYTALMGGDSQQAISIYKDIIASDPKNQDALFGLAATYHRQGNIEKARPIYGMLLKLNPNHREGLNNFLVLVGDESPQDAMPELERLEERNPDFSPIPAQAAIVLEKLGYKDLAREKMLRAIELAPDNLTYKYNLAVMLDRQGHYADASALYKTLIAASLRGEKVPATVDAMQKRLNYLTTAATSLKSSGV